MKRFLTLLVLLASVLQLAAQAPAERRPVWFGLNMGGTWQTSDMKALGGIGWGFTLDRYSRIQSPSPIYWGWRFRFLDGRNYGYNYHRLTGITPTSNPTLSSGATNYADSGSVYGNYKMRFDEFAFELMIGSNSLRKRGVLLYAFGGAGLTYWRAQTNQLDGSDGMYNYSAITGDGQDDVVRDQLDLMWDDTYETTAQSGTWSFMPSAGIGMGYQWGNGFAIGVEHRTTWALNDMIDGLGHNGLGEKTDGNDQYHYDGLVLRWTFGGGKSRHHTTNNPPPPPPDPNTYTQNPPPPPTNTVVVTPPPDNSNPNPHNNPPLNPPTVRFTTPAAEPYTATVPNQQLVVEVKHVSSSNNITLYVNNQQSTNFSYNPNTDQMVFSHTLLPGTNVYQVTATNNAGSATDVQTIIFKTGTTTTGPLPPTVTITNPPSDPYTSATPTTTVNATVLNVATAAGIQVRRNGSAITNFTFDPNSHVVTFVANLQNGSNLYEVVGTNAVGSASDVVTINYNPVATVQPPVVTITNPANCPYSTKTQTMTITANITNITAANQASVVFNNQAVTNFTFMNHGSFGTVTFPVTLNAGVNNFTVTGTNTAGTNSKSCQITYKVTTHAVPPTVTITTPSTSPWTSPTQNTTVNATVLNVASQNEITVKMNNATVTGWVYNMNTHLLSLPTTLNIGNNVYTVTASNANGTDSKSTTIVYSPAPVVQPPVVNITTPADNPHITSQQGVTVVASVLNVTQSNQITVTTLTGQNVQFMFNSTAHTVTFTPTLVSGANQFTVTATNSAGTASDNTTIKLVQQSGGTTVGGTSGGGVTTAPGGGKTNPGSGNSNVPPPPPPPPAGGSGSTGSVTVTILDPPNLNVTTTSSAIAVTAKFVAVASTNEITVTVNNVALPGLNYNPVNGILNFTANLVSGTNTIVVSAANSNGSASKTLTVTYNPGSRSGSSGSGSSGGSTPRSGSSSSSGKSTTKDEPKSSGSSSSGSSGSSSSSSSSSSGASGSSSSGSGTTRPASSGSSSSGSAGGSTTTAPSTPRSGSSGTAPRSGSSGSSSTPR